MSQIHQKHNPSSAVEMDAGKFLHLINAGALSQHAVFAERIVKMGEAAGAEWKLASVDANSVVFEDVGAHVYHVADIKRLGKGRVAIENIRELRIVESKKENSFRKNVIELVESITENDNGRADAIFNRITAQRFRSSVIPESGKVTTRDGITRYVKVAKSIVEESVKPRIIGAICEALSENIKVSRGRVVEGIFGNIKLEFPICELTRRRVVARHMKNVAASAYMAEGFQERIKHIAALLSENADQNLDKAISISAEFLKEEQHFSLLTKAEMQKLMGNTLATQGCMNRSLAEDIGEIFYTTNCKVNRDAILTDWRITARMAEYAPLVENVRILAESDEFETDYEAFLRTTFTEDMTTKAAKAKMYLSALQGMKSVLAGSKADQDLVGSLDGYIVRLETAGDDVDDATLMEIEEMVASTSEGLLNDLQTLNEFDSIPEIDTAKKAPMFGSQDLGNEAGGGMGGMGGGAMGGGASLPLDKEEDLGLGAGDEGDPSAMGIEPGAGNDAGLGGAPGGAAPATGAAPLGQPNTGMPPPKKKPGMGMPPIGGALMQSTQRTGKPVNENAEMCSECKNPMAECKCEKESTDECMEDTLKRLDNKGKREFLQLELTEWKKNGAKFFAEDGQKACTEHLGVCAKSAVEIKENSLAQEFKNLVVEHTPVTEGIADAYTYKAPVNAKINNKYGVRSEDHEHTNLQKGMKETEDGLPEGGKKPKLGDAMGEAGEADMNVSPDGHADARLKKASQTKVEDRDPNVISCPECKGNFDLTECMTQKGSLCPDCHCDVSTQMMEALEISETLAGKGHQMDRIDGGKGVTKDGLKSVDGQSGEGANGGSKKQSMDRIGGGKGVAGAAPKAVEGTSGEGKGKKEGMDGQEGKGVAENQRKAASMRRRSGMRRSSINALESVDENGQPVTEETTVSVSGSEEAPGRTDNRSVTFTTDEPVDDVVSKIADTIALNGEGEGLPPELGGEGGEGGVGGDIEGVADELGGEGEEAGAAAPADMDGTIDDEGAMVPGEGEPIEGGAEEEFGGEAATGGEGEPTGEPEGETVPPEEEEEEEPAVGVPGGKAFGEDKSWLEKKIKEREGKGKEDGEKADDDDDDDDDDEDGKEGEEGKPFKEDNDITAPTSKKYSSEEEARKDGGSGSGEAKGGKERNPKPKFSDKDYNGTKGAKTARPYGSKE